MSTPREDELRDALAAVRERIERACAAAGRDPADLTLVVVTKHFPRSDVDLLAGLGVTDIGENTAQEASAKIAEAPLPPGVRVHFVGQLQSNKAREVARWADVVHSVDRPKIVRALARAADVRPEGRPPVVGLVQVDLDGSDAGRGGVRPDGVAELADAFVEHGLELGGVMAVAPREGDPAAAFARLAAISDRLRVDHPGARIVSAGMSGDLEAAVAAGATHLRVGRAILGSRQPHG